MILKNITKEKLDQLELLLMLFEKYIYTGKLKDINIINYIYPNIIKIKDNNLGYLQYGSFELRINNNIVGTIQINKKNIQISTYGTYFINTSERLTTVILESGIINNSNIDEIICNIQKVLLENV